MTNENDYLKTKNKELKSAILNLKMKHPNEVQIELSDSENSDNEQSEDNMSSDENVENNKVKEEEEDNNNIDNEKLELNKRIEELESEV